ncbi:MAG: DUF481 domain-containing protein [Gammaproteobacteria bacterium]|nr:DUF481 domain-containing protein [Gammaproteobacteria bacterium]
MLKNLAPVICLIPLIATAADDAETPGGWKGEGELGFTSTSGNTDSETLIANLGVSKEIELWKHSAVLKTIQAETGDVESADSLQLKARSDYKISEKSYLFGQLRYEDDEFSGYDYQASLAFGIGSRVIDNEQHLLDLYAGLGTRRLKDTETGDTEGDAIITAGLLYEYKISETAIFNQRFDIEEGDENTRTESETSLKLKIAGNLAAKIAYLVKRNSEVPAGTEKADKLTTISLVYGF